jgi:RNA recognition motif-containing protein
VQFRTPEEAHSAIQLDGKVLDGQFKLQAKLSEPFNKKKRIGALEEGREVVVKNLYWHAHEDEVSQLLSSCGTVENVRIPRDYSGKSKGMAFVVFQDKVSGYSSQVFTLLISDFQLSADTAVTKFNETIFKQRTITVELGQARAKRTQETYLREKSASAEMNGEAAGSPEYRPLNMTYKERTLALMNVPDTVTLARVQKLCEKFGALVKCVLRPDHSGALAEYADATSVAKAELALNGTELDGNKLRTGDYAELMLQKPEFKPSKPANRKKTTMADLRPIPLTTPHRVAKGAGRGKGGGLGERSRPVATEFNEKSVGGKSNDYFKNLMSGGGKKEEKGEKEEKSADDPMET